MTVRLSGSKSYKRQSPIFILSSGSFNHFASVKPRQRNYLNLLRETQDLMWRSSYFLWCPWKQRWGQQRLGPMGARDREDERSCVKGTGGQSQVSTQTHIQSNEYWVWIELYGSGPVWANEAPGLSQIHSNINFLCCVSGWKQYDTFKFQSFKLCRIAPP